MRHYSYPGDVLKLSNETWDNNDDILSVLIRMAFPARPEEMKNYMANAKSNNKVFRVTVPSEQVDDFKLFQKPTLVERKMNRKESVVDENIKEVVSN